MNIQMSHQQQTEVVKQSMDQHRQVSEEIQESVNMAETKALQPATSSAKSKHAFDMKKFKRFLSNTGNYKNQLLKKDFKQVENKMEDEEDEEEYVDKLNSPSAKKAKKEKKEKPKSKKRKESSESDEDDDDEDGEVKFGGKKNPKWHLFFYRKKGDDDNEEDDEDYDPEEDEDDEEDEEDSESETDDDDEDVSVSSVDTDDLDDEDELPEEEEEKLQEKMEANKYLQKMYKQLNKQKRKDPKLKKMINACEENMRVEHMKQYYKDQKTKRKYQRIFKKNIISKNKHNNDVEYFREFYSLKEQQKLIKQAKELKTLTQLEKPYCISILEKDIPPIFKAQAMQKVHAIKRMDTYTGEYHKNKNWIDTFMKIPFNNYVSLPVTIEDGVEKCNEFMETAKQILDESVYGLNDAKMQIMQILGQLISNPTSTGTAIAIHGDKGVGKTSIVKDGISKILNRPFAFIPLGGATDSSYLEGHSYTYEGSSWGKIVQILIDSQVMNPVIYFDELDKISDTPKGEEIASILTHLTDTSQNMEFHDKYFSDLHFDLSKCIFIFSYNDETKINPILRDRMYRIQANGYDKSEKTIIARDYLMPKIIREVNFSAEDIVIDSDIIGYVIERYGGSEAGVRNLKRCLEIIYTKLNLCRLMKPGTQMFDKNTTMELVFPFRVTREVVDKIITKKDGDLNPSLRMMYV